MVLNPKNKIDYLDHPSKIENIDNYFEDFINHHLKKLPIITKINKKINEEVLKVDREI